MVEGAGGRGTAEGSLWAIDSRKSFKYLGARVRYLHYTGRIAVLEHRVAQPRIRVRVRGLLLLTGATLILNE